MAISTSGCSASANRKLLKTIPYRDLGCGLVLTADWVYGDFRAMITNELLEQTGLTRKQLFDDALKSMSEREPAVLFRLSDAVLNMPGHGHNLLEDPGESDIPVSEHGPESRADMSDADNAPLVLSNSSMYRGAAALFYPGVIEKIHAVLNDDYYIIPSSIHELIIVSSADSDPEALTVMLRSANKEVVAEDDVLDDDIYICRSGRISRASYGGVIPDTRHPVS